MSAVDRTLGIALALLVVCLVLPTLARYATEAVPVLISILVLLALLRFFLPARSRPRK
jgi:hypothetical protein